MNESTESLPAKQPKHPALRRRLAIVGLTAGLVAGGAAGAALGGPVISGAQDTTTTAPAAEAPADPAATPPADRPDPGTRLTEVLQPLVDDGTITQAQLEAVVAALQEAGPMGGGHGGPGGHHRGAGLDAAAESLGLTVEELRTELQGGSSIADVAAGQGVDVQVVIDAMVAEVKAHLDEEVASGEHTQEEADTKLAEATERITAMVNGEAPAGGFPGGPGGHGFGPGGPGELPEADATE